MKADQLYYGREVFVNGYLAKVVKRPGVIHGLYGSYDDDLCEVEFVGEKPPSWDQHVLIGINRCEEVKDV